jgi:multidrug resistance efflux pump
MVRKYVLPLLAVAMLLFAVYHAVTAQQVKPKLEPPVPPARMLYRNGVAGAGIVESQTENISVGAYVPGVVTEVFVKVGQHVKKGDRLFRLDDRQLRAELKYRQANVKAMEAQYTKLKEMPRKEELPPSEAKVRTAQANVTLQQDLAERARKLVASRAMAEEDINQRLLALEVARQQLAQSKAEYDLLNAGAWAPDKDIALASVEQAKAQVEQTETDLDRLVVTALVDGRVLKVDVRPGEYVGAPPGQALVVLGNVSQLHVRVDIDEHDIPRYRPGTKARATLRGDPRQEFELRYVREEPYVIPKKSLTGDNTERVDTRVLQVIYAIEDTSARVYVGQQVDVTIPSPEP